MKIKIISCLLLTLYLIRLKGKQINLKSFLLSWVYVLEIFWLLCTFTSLIFTSQEPDDSRTDTEPKPPLTEAPGLSYMGGDSQSRLSEDSNSSVDDSSQSRPPLTLGKWYLMFCFPTVVNNSKNYIISWLAIAIIEIWQLTRLSVTY